MMKAIIFLSVFFCLVGAQSSYGKGCGLVVPSTISLGSQPGCSVGYASLPIHNPCSKSMVVQITKSDAAIKLKVPKILIGPGKGIKVPFSTIYPKRLGRFTKTITLAWKTLGVSKPQKTTVRVNGYVKDFHLRVQPTKIDLGTLAGGKGMATGLTIRNAGSCSMRVWLSSNDRWIKAFYPSEFTLSPKGGNKEEGVFCYVNAPQKIGPFKGTITVRSDAGHRVDIPIHGDTLGLNLSAHRNSQSTVLLKWNNPSKMEGRLIRYLIYVNGKQFALKRYDSTPTEMGYLFDRYECDKTYTFYVEGIFSSNENRAHLRSNEITFSEGPLNDKPVFDCLPIYGTMRDWVDSGSDISDNGVDFHAVVNTTCLAVFDGEVLWAGWAGNWVGNIVYIIPDKKFSYEGYPIDCVFYSHLNEMHVKTGDVVHAGQTIGLSGVGDGDPHLHFGICQADPNINWETESHLTGKRCPAEYTYTRELVYEILGVWYKKNIFGNCNEKIPEISEKVPKDQQPSILISRDRLQIEQHGLRQ